MLILVNIKLLKYDTYTSEFLMFNHTLNFLFTIIKLQVITTRISKMLILIIFLYFIDTFQNVVVSIHFQNTIVFGF
jgi:hypothetical protein